MALRRIPQGALWRAMGVVERDGGGRMPMRAGLRGKGQRLTFTGVETVSCPPVLQDS